MTELITADSGPYVAALDAAAAAAEKAALAQERLNAAIAEMMRLMAEAAAGAAAAAAAESEMASEAANVAAAQTAAAGATAGLTAAVGAEAAAVRDLGVAWTEEEAKQAAADAAAQAFGRDIAAAAREFDAFMNDRLHASMQNLEQDLYIQANSASALDKALGQLAVGYRDAFAGVDPMTAALDQLRENFNLAGLSATDMADYTERSFTAMGRSATTAAGTAGRAWAIQIGWLRLTGTTLHWLIAGSAEFLAVAIPAFVAAGAAAAVMAQGAQNAYIHLSAVYAATEATANVFHQTAGQYLGLGDALQKAQNAADPHVYELLGAGLNIAKTAAGGFVSEGTKVLGILDTFAAKVTAEMQGALGSQLHSLLSGGVNDLTQFGQVLGNVGHAVLNLAGDMPGLAHVLLDIIDGASRLINVLSGMPGWIITAAMGFEEFNRWGSLVVSTLGRIFGATVNLQGGFFTFTRFGSVLSNLAGVFVQVGASAVAGIGRILTSLGSLWVAVGTTDAEITAMDAQFLTMGAAASAAGGRMAAMAVEMRAAAAAITPLQAALGIGFVAGMVALIAVTHGVQNATQAWITSLNQSVDAANNLKSLGTISGALTQVTQRQAETQKALNNVYSGAQPVVGQYARAVSDAKDRVTAFANEQQHLSGAVANVLGGIGFLSREYGTTFVGALELANQAGVHLAVGITGQGAAATAARVKIANYVAGLEAMGATTSTVGHDVTLLGIQSALASSHVQQLQQAFSSFVTNMTSGTSNLAAMNLAIRNIGQVSQSAQGPLSQLTGNIKLSTNQAADALRNFGAVGSQVWQNFDGALSGSASQLVQWFQLAGTEGATSSQQFSRGIMDVVASFQQVASKSPAARAELVGFANAAGMNVSSWADLERQLKAAGASASGLPGIISAITGRMSNMNSVARALGSSLSSSVIASMNSARVAASGLGQAAQAASAAWFHFHTVNTQVAASFRPMYTALNDVYHNTSLAKNAINAFAQQLGMSKGQIQALDSALGIAATRINNVKSNFDSAARSVDTHAKAVSEDTSKAAENAAKLADQAGSAAKSVAAIDAHSRSMNTDSSSANNLSGKVNDLNGKMSTAASAAQRTAAQYQQTGNQAQTAAGKVSGFHGQIDGASSAAISGSAKMAQLAGAIQHAGSMAATATGQVQSLAGAINALQSKTITITTVMSTVHRAAGGPVYPGIPAIVGEYGQELFIPATPGYIVPHTETQRILSGASGGGTQPGGGFTGEIHVHNDIQMQGMVDQGVLFNFTKQETARYGIRNGVPQQGRLAPAAPGR